VSILVQQKGGHLEFGYILLGSPLPGDVRARTLSSWSSTVCGSVSQREYLVDWQDPRFKVGNDGEGRAHTHAAATPLHRHIQGLLRSREGYDLDRLVFDLSPLHAQKCTVQEEEVLAPACLARVPSARGDPQGICR
jgi:hypothetical protein